ncbi:MAG TPA: hypothetical protein DDW65_14395 [Firmicutes bacterium]|jgi:hypothetical protein|nr:hypothetical protein [Bacillota bacterium]
MFLFNVLKSLQVLIIGTVLCLTVSLTAHAAAMDENPLQSSSSENNGLSFGMEVDALPYVSGGHYISGVIGFDHYNLRLISTKTTIPGFVTPDGFKDWDLDVTAVILDYFPGENREGLWLGGGMEFWDSKIRTKNTGDSGSFSQKIITLGAGYVYNLNEHWYINPWAAIHYNLSDKNVAIGASNLDIPDIMYEASVKLGYKF